MIDKMRYISTLSGVESVFRDFVGSIVQIEEISATLGVINLSAFVGLFDGNYLSDVFHNI